MVYEVFVPYNCRLFLVNMLSVPEAYRTAPSYSLQEKMILHLWPDVLSEPINTPAPVTATAGVRKWLGRIGRKVVQTTKRITE